MAQRNPIIYLMDSPLAAGRWGQSRDPQADSRISRGGRCDLSDPSDIEDHDQAIASW